MKKFALSTWFYFLVPSILGITFVYDTDEV